MSTPFYLASQSPRRADYLRLLGVEFTQFAPDYEEVFMNEASFVKKAEGLVLRKLQQFGQALRQKEEQKEEESEKNWCALVADTLVVIDGKILGKPNDAAHAAEMLHSLSGKQHQALTSVCIGHDDRHEIRTSVTDVQMKELSSSEIKAYISTGEPMDKAGAYGLQGLGGAFVESINGSFSGVIGLPLTETLELLNEFHIPHQLV